MYVVLCISPFDHFPQQTVNSSYCSYQGDVVCGLCECVEGWLVLLRVVHSRGAVSVGWHVVLSFVALHRVGDKCQCNTTGNSGPMSLTCPYVHSTGVYKMCKSHFTSASFLCSVQYGSQWSCLFGVAGRGVCVWTV